VLDEIKSWTALFTTANMDCSFLHYAEAKINKAIEATALKTQLIALRHMITLLLRQ
jgi:hypothetical protein